MNSSLKRHPLTRNYKLDLWGNISTSGPPLWFPGGVTSLTHKVTEEGSVYLRLSHATTPSATCGKARLHGENS